MVIDLNDIESFEEIIIDELYDLTIEDNSNYFLSTNTKSILVHNSSKTQDAFHLIETFCDHNRDKPLKIGIFRNTLKDCREKTYDDFKKFLKQIRGIYNVDNARGELSSPTYNLYGSTIEFRGLDDETEQKGYDIVFINETLEVESETKIIGLIMRCTKLCIFDWNPKYTQHWVFEWENRPFVYFTKTTYKNNKHLEKSIVTFIESRSPWNLEDLYLPKNERRPNIENVKNKTCDEWWFEVYGMGIRANRDGLIFPNVTWINSFPNDSELDVFGYGLDFGFTQDPSAFVKVGLKENKEGKSDLYLDLKIYEPTANADVLFDMIKLIEPNYENYNVWADCSAPLMIGDLRRFGMNIYAVTDKSIMYGIDLMNRFNIHIVYSPEFKKEQENYCYRTIHGIAVNEPIDKFNHAFDASRYFCLSELRRYHINN